MLGGPILFLFGTVLFRRVLEKRWARAQLAGLGVLGILGGVELGTTLLDTLQLAVAAALVLVGVATGETVGRVRRGRRSG